MAKRPRDLNQLAKLVVDIVSGEIEDTVSESMRQTTHRGRAGGLKGGVARAAALTPENRKTIAKKAAEMRWAAQAKDSIS